MARNNPVLLTGPTRGLDGRGWISKARDPNITDGRIGDMWFNTLTHYGFGPKTAAGWGAGSYLRGPNGWTPLTRVVSDGTRRVREIYDWTGGAGTKPATGYEGATGIVPDIEDAVDFRGEPGPEALINALDAASADLTDESLIATGEDASDNEKRTAVEVFDLGGTLDRRTVAHAQASNVRKQIGNIRTQAFSDSARMGGAHYKRVNAQPAHGLCFRTLDRWTAEGAHDSANGGWWEIDEPEIRIEMAGSARDQVTINKALAAASVLGVGEVKGIGECVLSGPVIIPAGVRLNGMNRKLTLKQAAGANLGELVLLSHASGLVDCVVDGGRGTNADNDNYVTVRIGNMDDCVVERNIIKNCTGYGVVVNNGVRAKIKANEIHNFRNMAIAAYGNSGHHSHEITDNNIHTIGWGGIVLQHSDYSKLLNNQIVGQLIGGRTARLTINTSGKTVTWASGPKFVGVMAGNWVVFGGGLEFRIASVDSDTQLTVHDTMPTTTDSQASVGSGDLIGVIASNHTTVSKNHLESTTTFLFGYSLGSTAVQDSEGIFSENVLHFAGKNAVNLSGAGAGWIDNASLTGNKIYNAGYGGGIGELDRVAILLAGVTPGTISNIHLSGNSVISYAGEGQTSYWFGTDGGVAYGAVSVGVNTAIDMANPGILNDVVVLELSPGWGSTAVASDIVSTGNSLSFKITCSGTGFAAGASFVAHKVVDSYNPPMPQAKVASIGGTAVALADFYGENLSTRGNWAAILNGTPSAGHEYTVFMQA